MATLVNTTVLTIGSPVFSHKGYIPSKYTCEGENINPSLTIENIPAGTKSLTLIVDDPDAAGGTFDHWITWNIRPMEMILENTSPGTEGRNSFGTNHYRGPCPPSGTHRYFFKVYALDALLDVTEGADKSFVEKAMQKHIIGQGEIIGMYRKSK
jgi:Raf kinase inhibitor-like YbhB/YbcL family protein